MSGTNGQPYWIDGILPAGQVMQRGSYDALAASLAANGAPLTEAEIVAAVGPALPPVTSLPILDPNDPDQNVWLLLEPLP